MQKLSHEEQAKLLESRGWLLSKRERPKLGIRPARAAQWSHPSLSFLWPQGDAVRLELEQPRPGILPPLSLPS